jgi:hypothetical protein
MPLACPADGYVPCYYKSDELLPESPTTETPSLEEGEQMAGPV